MIALCGSVQEGLWFKKLLYDLNVKVEKIVMFEDNQGCINLIKNPENNKRVKHIDIKYNFVCENLKKKIIDIKYVCSERQNADILTKGLPKLKFYKLREEIGLYM